MIAGDEADSWNDAGPCPACGQNDCWLGCPDAEIDTDVQNDIDEMLCGCDYCTMVGHPCWQARSRRSNADKVIATIELSPEGEAVLLELLGRPTTTGTDK